MCLQHHVNQGQLLTTMYVLHYTAAEGGAPRIAAQLSVAGLLLAVIVSML